MRTRAMFLGLLRPYKAQVIYCFICIVAANLTGLVMPWAIKLIVDDVLINHDYLLLNWITIGLLIVFVARLYFSYMNEYLCAFVGEKVVCNLRGKLHWHLQRLSLNFIENSSSGEMISRIIGDVDGIRNFLFGGALDFVYSLFNLVFVLGVLFYLDWRLTIVSLIYLPIFAIAYLKVAPELEKKHLILREKYAELTSRLSEVFNGIRVVRIFGRSNYEDKRFAHKQNEIFNSAVSTHKLGIWLWAGAEFLSSLGFVTLLWFGARAVLTGRISPGVLLAFYSYLGMLFAPVIKMAVINNDYLEACASMKRINQVFTQEHDKAAGPDAARIDRMRGEVEFKNVSFKYSDGRQALININFKAKPGEVIALVGPSGTGKTTIVSLLARFFDPTRGRVLIDGHDLKSLDLDNYRKKIAIVLQDDFLFSDTIRENIIYGLSPDKCSNLSLDDQRVIQAAKLANAYQFVVRFPKGFATEIGERGVRVSGGQRQRLAIARALLRDPGILILDEATSSLDSQTEYLIQEALDGLMRARTTFIIAHRLSTVVNADKIVVIDQGRIIQTGNHNQLVSKKGLYQTLYHQQWGHFSSQMQLTR